MKNPHSLSRFIAVVLGLVLLTGATASGDAEAKGKTHTKVSLKISVDGVIGTITIELFDDITPITVKNFLHYVDTDFYNGTIFHRVIDNFMIQGGGMSKDLTPKQTGSPIKNEADLCAAKGIKNLRGTVAMARTSVVDSATSQFFINVIDNPHLDYKGSDPGLYGYCVFGRVSAGMDVVDKIKRVKTTTKGYNQNVPAEDIVIISAERVK